MKIWQLDIEADKYKCLELADKKDWDLFDNFDGRTQFESWYPIKVDFIKSAKKKKIPDAIYLSPSAPVFNNKSIEVLKKYMDGDVEFLSLGKLEDMEYYIINPIKVVDCIDQEKSEFQRFSDGRIMWCNQYSFVAEKVKGLHIFRILEVPRALILVSDEFKQKTENSKLEGFIFKELWDSEK